MADFSNAKVGDKVWDLILGECEVEFIKDGRIHVLFTFEDKSQSKLTYDFKGFSTPEIKVQLLYHSKPEIIEAKRVITKEIEIFVNTEYLKEITSRIGTCNFSFLFSTLQDNNTTKCKLTFEIEE